MIADLKNRKTRNVIEKNLDCFFAALLAMTKIRLTLASPQSSLRAERSNPEKLHFFIAISLCFLLAACSSGPEIPEFCTTGKTIAPKKATSRPYQIKGIWYYPQPHFEYDEVGLASYYGGGDVFHGRKTATGERFDMNEVSAAHKTLPLPCVAIVTNLENGREIQVKVNDRGPFVEKRIIDLSRRTAQLLGFEGKGLAKVRVRTLVPESLVLHGIDPSTVLVEQQTPKALAMAPLPTLEVSATRLPEMLFDAALDDDIIENEKSEQNTNPLLAKVSSVSPAKPTSSQSKGIYITVRTCKSQKEAHRVLQQLIGRINAPPEVVQQKGPKPFLVRVGPFLSIAEANQTLDQLINAGHVMSRITIQR